MTIGVSDPMHSQARCESSTDLVQGGGIPEADIRLLSVRRRWRKRLFVSLYPDTTY